MKIAIMQPYFTPYIGYFQLIGAVDKFVVYDNIQYTKKGWINRNRLLINGSDEYITLPLKKDSDYLNVLERYLSETFAAESTKTLRKIKESYRKAPNFESTFPLVEQLFTCNKNNLFDFIFSSLQEICNYLAIKTDFVISSSIEMDHTLRSEQKVIEICRQCGADEYLNPIGGLELYSPQNFMQAGIKLNFIKSNPITYKQFDNEFIPWLSIIDVLMFNSKEQVMDWIKNAYTIINKEQQNAV